MTGQVKYRGVHRRVKQLIIPITLIVECLGVAAVAVMVAITFINLGSQGLTNDSPSPSPQCAPAICATPFGVGTLTSEAEADRVKP